MRMIREVIPAVAAADGSVTVYSKVFSGKIHSIRYVKTDYADTVDFAITVEGTGEGVWTEANVTAAKTCAPRLATHDVVGVAAVYAAGGSPVLDRIGVAADRVKFAITNAGNAKIGAFHLVFESSGGYPNT